MSTYTSNYTGTEIDERLGKAAVVINFSDEFTITSLGVSGTTTQDFLDRLDEYISAQTPLELQFDGARGAMTIWRTSNIADSTSYYMYYLSSQLLTSSGFSMAGITIDSRDLSATFDTPLINTGASSGYTSWVRGSLYLATTSTVDAALNYYLGGDDNITTLIECIDNFGTVMLNNAMENDAYVSPIEYVTYNWSSTNRVVGFKIPLESTNNIKEIVVDMTDTSALSVTSVTSSVLDGSVQYTEQTLTDEQQEQARENIGAVSTADITAAINSAINDSWEGEY